MLRNNQPLNSLKISLNIQLVCSCSSNCVDGCLIICKNEIRVHIMGLEWSVRRHFLSLRGRTSFIRPKMTFSFVLKRLASSPQNAANWAVVAAVTSEVFPMMLPVIGC
jgi:hypothetical protein